MTSRGRLLLSRIEAAVPGEGATRIIRRDIQGDTERGYAERGRQYQQFPLVEIEHRVSQPLIGTSRGGLIGEIDIAATASAQTEYRPVHQSGAERHAPRACQQDSLHQGRGASISRVWSRRRRSCWSILLSLQNTARPFKRIWIASPSLSSGGHSPDPLARNDGGICRRARTAKRPLTAPGMRASAGPLAA